MQQKEKTKRKYFEILVFCIYAILTLIFIFFHENWRDEAQQWLIVKELDFSSFLNQLRYEGHFILWYLILMPFAKLGFPYITGNIISWIICCISAIIILKKSPFSKWKKLLIVFSFPMIYLYPVITRCYCLIPLAVCLVSMLYKDRYLKPKRYMLSVLFLTNTHIIMLGMVVYLFFDFVYGYYKNFKNRSKIENRKILNSIIFFVIFAIASGLPLLGSVQRNKDVDFSFKILNIIISIFIQPLVMLQENMTIFSKNEIILAIAIICIGYITFYWIRYKRKSFIKIIFILLWQSFIYSFIFAASSQKAASLIFIFIFFCWNNKQEKENSKERAKETEHKIYEASTISIMIISIITGLIYACLDILYPYSSSKEVANYIDKNFDKNTIILTGNQPECCSSIIAYTNKARFYLIEKQDYITYTVWDQYNRQNLSLEDFEKSLEKFEKEKELYYIYEPIKVREVSDEEVVEKLIEANRLEKIFESKISMTREEYIIYKINR